MPPGGARSPAQDSETTWGLQLHLGPHRAQSQACLQLPLPMINGGEVRVALSALKLTTSLKPQVLPQNSRRLQSLTHTAPHSLPCSRQRILAQSSPETGLESQLPESRARAINHRASPSRCPRAPDGLRSCSRSFCCCEKALTDSNTEGLFPLPTVTFNHQVKPRQELKAASGSKDHGGLLGKALLSVLP